MPRQRDESKTKTIYEATLKLVLETGYTGLKMADVAKSASLATGTLYIYFKNKEVLINELFLTIKEQKMKDLMKVLDPSDEFEITFRKLWFNYTRISLGEPERMIFIEQFVRSSYLSTRTKQKSDKMLQPLADFLEHAVKEGKIKKLPSELLMAQLIGPVYELVKLQYDGKLTMTPSLVEACFQMAWNGIKK